MEAEQGRYDAKNDQAKSVSLVRDFITSPGGNPGLAQAHRNIYDVQRMFGDNRAPHEFAPGGAGTRYIPFWAVPKPSSDPRSSSGPVPQPTSPRASAPDSKKAPTSPPASTSQPKARPTSRSSSSQPPSKKDERGGLWICPDTPIQVTERLMNRTHFGLKPYTTSS